MGGPRWVLLWALGAAHNLGEGRLLRRAPRVGSPAWPCLGQGFCRQDGEGFMQALGPSGEVLEDDAQALLGGDACGDTALEWCGQFGAEISDCYDLAKTHA